VGQRHPFYAEAPGCLGQQLDRTMRLTALQAQHTLAHIQITTCRQLDMTGNRSYLS
jgi:hypothetical protein